MATQTSMNFPEEFPIPETGALRLHDGKYATKEQFVEDQEKTWKRRTALRIMRLEAEKEVDRRKIESLVAWLRTLEIENKKLKIVNKT